MKSFLCAGVMLGALALAATVPAKAAPGASTMEARSALAAKLVEPAGWKRHGKRHCTWRHHRRHCWWR
jgi:hypothetical protein